MLDFITEEGETYVLISERSQLDEVVNRITKLESFAYRFKFSGRELFISFLEGLKIKYEDFTTKYYHFDATRKLHVSESEFGYVWISTVGLVADKKANSNRAVNSCLNQFEVVSLLLEKAIELTQDDKVYDIDSHSFGVLSNLSPAIYHNVVFYIEVFCKAYLSLTRINPKHTHKLSIVYQQAVETMNTNGHGDSLFQVLVLDPLYKFVDHLSKIPGDFKEHFIKYDDNPEDDTVILFDLSGLNEMKTLIEMSVDFINDYFYEKENTHYLKPNLYQRLLERANTEEEKKKIQKLYPHLAPKKM